jgi:hypothetical protein
MRAKRLPVLALTAGATIFSALAYAQGVTPPLGMPAPTPISDQIPGRVRGERRVPASRTPLDASLAFGSTTTGHRPSPRGTHVPVRKQ